ncbi:hypothetical protein BX661DRAFT_195497 [Kickxella alabastrina]|uniref:uncharacterized protein n=1 Tax=Kickxella alabastrina TaxID=61397 RepID=UPI002220AD8B|nr:uncharacterized protein BX661DRAFT_195497 [Kickxella alabastrina]KAI7834932.1 hypothetical protein BX661DRAFT_195497 [Kickxella alabastrina]KAJ1947903.1 hypothetical protein GGF37_000050 [Kickxella alabastrina]
MQIISQQYTNHPISAPASRFTRQEPQSQLPQDHSASEFIEGDDGDESGMGCYDEMRNSAIDNGLDGDGNVMTTAKIRTIHKLAERRRRREMKNLFDMLRKCLPIDKTIRLSKWEVLKKSIEVISSQDTEIHMLRAHIAASSVVPNGSTDINKIFSNSSTSNGSN